MRIGLNLLHALPEIGGGWNYIECLLKAMAEHDARNEYFAFVTSASEGLVPDRTNFKKIPVRINARMRLERILYENIRLPSLGRRYRLDCLHWFSNTGAVFNSVPAAVTIYDLHVYFHRRTYSRLKSGYLRFMISSAAKRAAMLLPMSEATAADLRRRFDVDPSRLAVIPAVLNDSFKPADQAAVREGRSRLGLGEQFWLYVAHYTPHKNHVRLLQAYAQLKQQGFRPWPLVLRGDPRGGESLIHEAVGRYQLDDDVVFLPILSPQDLSILYASASGLIYPSLFEGGGMPVAEAMACGCPVAGAAIPVVQELAGDAAVYFDPLDVSAMERTMMEFQRDEALRETLRQRGLMRVAGYRPESVVQTLLQAYACAASR